MDEEDSNELNNSKLFSSEISIELDKGILNLVPFLDSASISR